MRLLLVEDSPKLSFWLGKALRHRGYVVDVCHDGAEADGLLGTERFDAVVLDLSLPSLDGLTVLQRMRERHDASPVIILTARVDVGDRVRGLNLGADDYVPKPFDLSELEARLQAVIRRANGRSVSKIALGPLQYDGATRMFALGDERLVLRPKEHAILELLLLRAGKAISKSTLHESIASADGSSGQDVVEIYIHRLRKQLERSAVSIVTLRGLGYVLEAR